MTFTLWISYILTSLFIIAAPGPSITFSQIFILGITFLGLVFLTGIIYIKVADKITQFLNNNSQKWIYRIGAINLIITGIAVLDLQQFIP